MMANRFKVYQLVSWSLYFSGVGFAIAGLFAEFAFIFKIHHPFALIDTGILLCFTSNVVYQSNRSGSTLKFWRIDNPYCWLSGLIAALAIALTIRIIAS